MYLVCVLRALVPTLVMIPVTITDFIAYPLAIGGVTASSRSLKDADPRAAAAVPADRTLATLARIEYFVLVPAYLVGAVVLDRGARLRRHAAVFLDRARDRGRGRARDRVLPVDSGSFRWSMATWLPLQAFLVTAIAGAVIVPGAVAALRTACRSNSGRVLAHDAHNDGVAVRRSQRARCTRRTFQRALRVCGALPLIAIAFAYIGETARRHRLIVFAVAAAIAVAAAQLPVSYYNAFAPKYDAQSLNASWYLKQHLGAAASSAIVAIFLTAAAVLAVVIALRPRSPSSRCRSRSRSPS